MYSDGESERIIGKALKGKRDQVVLATKCGLKLEGKDVVHDLSEAALLKEIDDSLSRLQTDYIDLYQLHWPDANVSIESTMHVLEKLKAQGKIRYVGLSNHSPELFDRALTVGSVVSSQDQYSFLDRGIEETLLPYLKTKDIGVLAYGPLAGGVLTGKYQEAPFFKKPDARKFFYKGYEGEEFQRVQAVLKELEAIGKPLNEVAINWVRQQQGVASVLVGARNAEQVQKNVQALSWDLTEPQLEFCRHLFEATIYG